MNNLEDLTIVIPVKIESSDRYNNLKIVLGYINHHFKTNVKIIEESNDYPKIDFLEELQNLSIDYKFYQIKESVPYHRTKYLNEMIFSTKTKVVSNYDTDVFFPVDTYINVVKSIINDEYDFIYPYLFGSSQKQLFYSKWYEDKENNYRMLEFTKDWNIDHFNDDDKVVLYTSSYGHSIFANTQRYKEAFGENEGFVSYGPEDQERAYRFQKLGYRVNWYNGYVYHIEHVRTSDSADSNPFFIKNWELYNNIRNLNIEELKKYYMSMDYIKKYKI